MKKTPLQDYFLPFGETCFGCGGHNQHGLRIKSFEEGEEVICDWTPAPHHMAGPGFVNGGVLATLIDCHAAITAGTAALRAEGKVPGETPPALFVTASLKVDYLRPTRLDAPIHLRARAIQQTERKTIITCELFSGGPLSAGGVESARGEGVFVRVDPGKLGQ